MESFKSLLKETGITRNHTWEQSIPLICFDERYTLLPIESKKRLFDDYSRKLLENMPKKVRIEKTKHVEAIETPTENISQINEENLDSFIEMLSHTPNLSIDSKWSELKDKVSLDPRIESIPADRREKEFYNYIYSHFVQNSQEGMEEFKERIIPYLKSLSPWKDISHHFEDEFEHLNKAQIYQELLEMQKDSGKKDFQDLLLQTYKKTKLLQKNTPTMGKKFNDLKKHLSMDPRWKSLATDQERETTIANFIWELNQK